MVRNKMEIVCTDSRDTSRLQHNESSPLVPRLLRYLCR